MRLALAHRSESPHTSRRWCWRTFQSESSCEEFAWALLVFRRDRIVSPERGRWKEGVEKRLSHCAKMLGLYRPLGTWLQFETLFLPSLSVHTLQLRSTMQALVAMVTGGARAAVMEGEPSEGFRQPLECGLTSNTPNSLSISLALSIFHLLSPSLRRRSWRCAPSALKARCFLLSLCCCERSNSQGALHLSDSQFVLTFFWWAHKCACLLELNLNRHCIKSRRKE